MIVPQITLPTVDSSSYVLLPSAFLLLVQTAGIGLIVIADAPEDKVPTIVALNLTACSMLYYAGWTKGESPVTRADKQPTQPPFFL